MANITYEIPMLSARGIISYAQKKDDESYSFNLSSRETERCLINKENSLQQDCAMFYQIMSVLTSDKFIQPKKDMTITDLMDVIVYIDFSGIFDRDSKSERIRLRQLKAKYMFSPEGINLDLGTGIFNFVAFERSASMSRNARLSFIRSDIYEEVKSRIQLDMDIGLCQLSKLYAYNGLMFSGGTRIESKYILDDRNIVVVPDMFFKRKEKVITVESDDENSAVKKYSRAEKEMEIDINAFDGEGIMSSMFAIDMDTKFCGKHIHSSFQIRLPYIKGMLHEVDLFRFFESMGVHSITDIWGVEHEVRRINMIIPESMFKGKNWLKENNMTFTDYINKCIKYRHTMYITNVNKINPEPKTEINFQFLNTLAISEEDFRPKDLPLGWNHSPSDIKREWLTKTTEQEYYDYCNNREFRIKYFTDNIDTDNKRRSVIARMISKNNALIDEPAFAKEVDSLAESILKKYAVGQLIVKGENRFLSSDLLAFMLSFVPETLKRYDKIKAEEIPEHLAYIPVKNSEEEIMNFTLLRNPHISKNESVTVKIAIDADKYRKRYLRHLKGVTMVAKDSLYPMRLGGADFDGDMVKYIADYTISNNAFDQKYQAFEKYPLLYIPTEEPIISDAKNWEARFETVKNTFSSRVGQISNAAFNRSIIAYDENTSSELKEQYRKETETLAILTGLEIDSAKSGVKPDLSEYLVHQRAPRSLFLKYKTLLEKKTNRRAWYEKTYDRQYREFFKNTDWNNVSSNLERLPYYAYELKKNTPKAKDKPASDNEIFIFAEPENWKKTLDKKKLNRVSALMKDYDHCLRRIRNHKNTSETQNKKSDIERILFMRGQEDEYDTDELISLFTDFSPEEIEEIYNGIREEKWQFIPYEEREAFLRKHLPSDKFEEYFELFCDFRHNGDRVFSDIICDRYATNNIANLTLLHFENDSNEMTSMMLAYRDKTNSLTYRESVTEECRRLLSKIIRLSDAAPYVVAAGYRKYVFDILLSETEKYIIDRSEADAE